jgi:hypothetical protein
MGGTSKNASRVERGDSVAAGGMSDAAGIGSEAADMRSSTGTARGVCEISSMAEGDDDSEATTIGSVDVEATNRLSMGERGGD